MSYEVEKSDITGIPPSCFGSIFWNMIHIIAIAYPEYVDNNDPIKITVYNFFNLLGDVLPCKECQIHYKQNFPKLNLYDSLDSRKSLSLWAYNLHNLVNRQLNVPESSIPTFEEVYNKYNTMRTENCGKESRTSSSSRTSSTSNEVCSTGPDGTKLHCKVEFIKEGYSVLNSSQLLNIILFIIIILLCVYIFKMK
jgi:hypothetical protein